VLCDAELKYFRDQTPATLQAPHDVHIISYIDRSARAETLNSAPAFAILGDRRRNFANDSEAPKLRANTIF
jgi:hypothetical protein